VFDDVASTIYQTLGGGYPGYGGGYGDSRAMAYNQPVEVAYNVPVPVAVGLSRLRPCIPWTPVLKAPGLSSEH
jgi:hypothetical protein